MKFKGVIFDLDGVICFTDKFHYQAWKKLADRLGIEFDEKINDRLRGVSRMASLEIILEKSARAYSDAEKESFAAEKNDAYRALLENMGKSDVSEEVRDTLSELRARGVLLAIGSSSRNTPLILEKTGMKQYFDAVSDGNNITRSKPDPEVFLKAAQFLNLAPADCLVVEDAVAGIDAGFSGGFRTAAIGEATNYDRPDYKLTTFSDLLKIVD
ncbi:beta-phosphoglucomutase [Candidatus Borkfalkia ceftriaxoniphila]|uniref:Beta-phosphoglucomutase n=1 Tax=Candidatus Borkfalkia ceftriaxoniphila TaxID=2508949 RepID=A0A4Q2K9Z2_9FIRM|nr:beta-phosphoglucomutase [Candidatus Borkfalkia ceftriaxoniphila]RXZ58095.1 beta-phosphoglucomutase [Candidatus Borkfalkia ceftriaxoniphila]